MPIVSLSQGNGALKTFDLLDQIVTILGGTKLAFWPFLTGSGEAIFPYGSGNDAGVLTSATALNAAGAGGHDPHLHPGGVYSYQVDGTADADRISAADDADYTFATGGVSWGAWVLMQEATGTARSIIAKYRSTAATQREYDLRISATGYPILEIYDEADGDWTSTCTVNVLTPFTWAFVVATYSGTEGASAIVHYLNGTAETPVGVETLAFGAMVDTTATLTIGSRDQGGASPTQVFQGRIALPFVTGKALTAANVSALYGIGKTLLGV